MKIKKTKSMKVKAYKSGAIILASLLFLSAAQVAAQEEVTKEFHKEYTGKQGTMLNLNNRYGDIVIQTSESDQVVINVTVTIKYPNKEKADRLLSYIDVQFEQGDKTISAKTIIDDKFNFSGWGDSRRFSIDYDVKMPKWMDLTLLNRYGNTDLDDLSGLVQLDIKYGSLTAANLTRGNVKPLNNIKISYGKASLNDAGWVDATFRYCGSVRMDKCQALLLDSKYSSVEIGTASSIVGETKYNKLRVDELNNLVLDAGYDDINIGTINRKIEFNGDYGSFNVDRVPAGFESVSVESHYMGVKVAIDNDASYNLKAHVSYGSLKFNEEEFQNQKRIIENNSSRVEGIVGKESDPKATVTVEASYGGVRLF
jgi:hypothetical protein